MTAAKRPFGDRFGRTAKEVLAHATKEARRLRHSRIGTAHILLALLNKRHGKAFRALTSVCSSKKLRQRLARLLPAGTRNIKIAKRMYLTSRASLVLREAHFEAEAYGKSVIEPEHLLLGLCRITDGTAARALINFEDETVDLYSRVVRTLRLKAHPLKDRFKFARGRSVEAIKFCQMLVESKLKSRGQIKWHPFDEDIVTYRGGGAYEVHANCEYSRSKSKWRKAIVRCIVAPSERRGFWGIRTMEISTPIFVEGREARKP